MRHRWMLFKGIIFICIRNLIEPAKVGNRIKLIQNTEHSFRTTQKQQSIIWHENGGAVYQGRQ